VPKLSKRECPIVKGEKNLIYFFSFPFFYFFPFSFPPLFCARRYLIGVGVEIGGREAKIKSSTWFANGVTWTLDPAGFLPRVFFYIFFVGTKQTNKIISVSFQLKTLLLNSSTLHCKNQNHHLNGEEIV